LAENYQLDKLSEKTTKWLAERPKLLASSPSFDIFKKSTLKRILSECNIENEKKYYEDYKYIIRITTKIIWWYWRMLR
jgi:hypothetical protein